MTHILIPRKPNPALLCPFISCPESQLPEAWEAMVRAAEVQNARAGRSCLAQIQEPAQPTSIVLDDRWKARILDGRALERDDMGLGDHPELPQLDEGMKPRGFFAALGLELSHTFAEDQLDGDALEAMGDAVNWTAWQPTPPQGDGWKLVAIFDTEDGPAAWWLRELAEAEDGTTTIRNLQAEIEKLKARMARVSRAGAAADSPTTNQATNYSENYSAAWQINALTAQKVDAICAREPYAVTGVVLSQPDGRACIVNQSAVRWFHGAGDFWNLMHVGLS